MGDVSREGLDILRTRLGRSNSDDFDESDEHHRYQLYIDALQLAWDDIDGELLTVILREPDVLVRQSALVMSLDSAALRHSSADLLRWADQFPSEVWHSAFIQRRLNEWVLYKDLLEGNLTRQYEVLVATDWLQRKVAADADSAEVLELLADRGRTRRVRSHAQSRLRKPRSK